MKRRLFVCFLALTMLLSLTACGASSKTAASVIPAPTAALRIDSP